jgi:hypothetical protein
MLHSAARALVRSTVQLPLWRGAPVVRSAVHRLSWAQLTPAARALFSSGAPSSGGPTGRQVDAKFTEEELADHSWRQVNHIWTEEELAYVIKTAHKKFEPKTLSDRLASGFMRMLYHSFNYITRYNPVDPTAKSIEWRLIILESFAGVPGFLAAGFRHFYSLRTLQRDHGAIYTFLEEAENERMHLLTCLKMFEASYVTRGLVITAQLTMTPLLMAVYAVHPPMVHRFVGCVASAPSWLLRRRSDCAGGSAGGLEGALRTQCFPAQRATCSASRHPVAAAHVGHRCGC